MAEQLDRTDIVKRAPDEYAITIKEYGASGQSEALTVLIPPGNDYSKWSILARAAILKQTTWAKFNVPSIILAVLFADKLGLDIELGDVYSTDGRPAISAEGRIKLALKTGKVIGIKTDLKQLDTRIDLPGCVLKNDLECTVTITVQGWTEPIVRKALLSRWFKPTPTWKERPEHQLELNTIGHACRLVAPIGDPDDTPPAERVLVPEVDGKGFPLGKYENQKERA